MLFAGSGLIEYVLVIETNKEFIKQNLNLNIESDPKIFINDKSVQNIRSKFKINNDQKNIILGIGGSGPTKRVSAEKFIELMNFCSNKFKCRFFITFNSKIT